MAGFTVGELPMHTITMDVKFSRPLRFRLWLGMSIMRLGAKILGISENIEELEQ